MNIGTAQKLFAARGWYSGPIDNDAGPLTWRAVEIAEHHHRDRYESSPGAWPKDRRLVGAVQVALQIGFFEPGVVDGWMGHNTQEALNAFLHSLTYTTPMEVLREPVPGPKAPSTIPLQSEVGRVYGEPGPEIEGRLVIVEFPFRFRIDWNLSQTTNRIRAHRDCAYQLRRALVEVRDHYGPDRWTALGLDRYAGAYNHRRMRGGSKWSMHAYGCAIDFYAAPNGLRTRCPQALFCGPDYKDFLDIMEAHEWLPAIRLWGADAMHFQRARIG